MEGFARSLKSKLELRELFDSRAYEQISETLHALQQQLGAEQATFGTRRDYLRWLIERNFYLDPRGTFQTQRQVQVKLDDIYISLQAQRDETPGAADRWVLEVERPNQGIMGRPSKYVPLNTLGGLLRERRKNLGLSLAQVADYAYSTSLSQQKRASNT